jgi:hypothetical protein
VRLLCLAFDPAHGICNLMVGRILAGAGAITLLLMMAGFGFLLLAGRRTTQ